MNLALSGWWPPAGRFHGVMEGLGILVAGTIAIRILRGVFMARLTAWADRTDTKMDDFLVGLVPRTVVPLAYVAVAYLALRSLDPTGPLLKLLDAAGLVLLTVFSIVFVISLAQFSITLYLSRRAKDTALEKGMLAFLTFLKVTIWGLGFVFILDNLGFRISSVIAGLGVGGIAVALAAQSILGDLFSYFTILLDRPFEIGDAIAVGDINGTVEYIGIRTTRLDSPGGEQIVMPNKDLTSSRVRNFKRMKNRRVIFRIGVAYETDRQRLKEIPDVVGDIVRDREGVVLERVHLTGFGDCNVLYEVSYLLDDAGFERHLDVQQDICLKILDAFAARGIRLACPTRTLYLGGPPPP